MFNFRNNRSSWSWLVFVIPFLLWNSGSDLLYGQNESTNAPDANSTQESKAKKNPGAKEPERAWEYNPYRVKVWICSDRSAEVNACLAKLMEQIQIRFDLVDPCCIRMDVETINGKWRRTFLNHIAHPEPYTEVYKEPILEGYDKIMVVSLDRVLEGIRSRVREMDIQTQQWGPMMISLIRNRIEVSTVVTNAMLQAFMPIAKVERITDKDEVFTRARAMKACITTEQTKDLEYVSRFNEESPVWIKPTDRFLPVIRRLDRNGDLKRLESIDYTFLTITKQSEVEQSQAECAIQSYHRAPLAGRASKRNQKLVLVIRPPNQPTELTLVSRDEKRQPMEGIEIWSRGPDEDKTKLEMIGKSDWQGKFVVPPSDKGMRLILLKRGGKGLMRLPIIPGLYPELTAEVRNDEARLFAEGVISGLNNEVLDLIAQRSLYESEIDSAIEKKDGNLARDILNKYRELPSTSDLKIRLSNEEGELKSMTENQRELDYITRMFSTLKVILNSEAAKSRESELTEKIQKLPYKPAARNR